MTGLVGLGMADFSLAGDLSQVVEEFTPGPDSGRRAEQRLRFVSAYRALEGWFAQREEM